MLTLDVDGQRFRGWLTAEIERELDSFAHRFSLTYLETVNGAPWRIRSGSKCELRWDDEALITGYVNRATFRASDDDWQLLVEGRSTSSDLVDCSAVHKTGSWTNRKPSQIANELASPFGVKVTIEASDSDEPFDRWVLEGEETVHDVFDRICKARSMLPITRPDGNAAFVRVGEGSSVRLPIHDVFSRELIEDDSERFSEYRTYSSNRVLSSDDSYSSSWSMAKAVTVDTGVERYRPKIILSDSKDGQKGIRARGEWERNVRAGRSEKLRYTMQTVQTHQPGQLVQVQDPVLGIDEQLVLVSSSIQITETGARTSWDLARVETYQTREYPPKKLSKRKQRRFT